jgi:hypothetical protein
VFARIKEDKSERICGILLVDIWTVPLRQCSSLLHAIFYKKRRRRATTTTSDADAPASIDSSSSVVAFLVQSVIKDNNTEMFV